FHSEPRGLAVGAVVFPAVDDAVADAAGSDTDGAAVLEIGAHVNLVVAIDVVVEAPDRAGRIVDGCHVITGARGKNRQQAPGNCVQLRPFAYRRSAVVTITHGTQKDSRRLIRTPAGGR